MSKVNLDIPLLYFKNRKLCFYGLSRIYLILSEVTESESSTIRKAPETLTANPRPATEPPSYYHFPGNKSFHTPESTLIEKPRSYFERHVNKFRIQSPKPGKPNHNILGRCCRPNLSERSKNPKHYRNETRFSTEDYRLSSQSEFCKKIN